MEKEKTEIFKTWDQWCLDKLKEIQPATQIEWTEAMGFKNTGSITTIIKKYQNLLTISFRNDGHKSKTYKLRNEEPLECDHEFISMGNNWFHWNTSEVMTTGRCLKCNLEKEIKLSMVKK